MATGVTSSITSDVSFTSKFQLTKDDDTLIISGAVVTLLKPQGDIFTNEGNDIVIVENAQIKTAETNLAFYTGSGDDTLTVKNSTLSAPISMGSGNDTVVVDGTLQTKVTLNKELSFGTGDDVLELISILENVGSIDFGSSGTGTIRFNGGSLLGTGTIGEFTRLDVMTGGGTTGNNLTLEGDQTSIILNGNFLGATNDKDISVFGGTTALSIGNNVRTNVRLKLNETHLVHTGDGNLEFSDHTGYAVSADKSVVVLHNTVVKGGNGLTGSNTNWNLENCDFSNSPNGIKLTGGTMDFQTGGMANHTCTAMVLSGTTLTASKLSLVNNESIKQGSGGAMFLQEANVDINDFRAINNNASGGGGGAIYNNGGIMTLTSALFSGNSTSIYPGFGSGGAIYQSGGVTSLTSASFSDNIAGTEGGAICLFGGVMTLTNATFSGNRASYYGGAIRVDVSGIVNMENTVFLNNSASSGGAIFLNGDEAFGSPTLNYVVTSGAKVTNVGNQGRGGWLYMQYGKPTVNILVEENGLLTIGDENGYDGIAGNSASKIAKNGVGYMLVNSDISFYSGLWDIAAGTLELARIARTLSLDNWTIGTDAKLVLSVKDDTIDMGTSKKIGTIDMGGGSDIINTSGYNLTDGTILLSDLTLTGGGRVSARLKNRSTTEGSTLRLNGLYLESEFIGNDYKDSILINAESQLSGAIDLGNGNNVIKATALTTVKNTVKMGAGDDNVSFKDVTMEDSLDLGDGNNELTITGTGKLQDVIGGSGKDTVTLDGEGTISGKVDLGSGVNAIHVNETLTADKIIINEGGETTIYAYYGSTITNNALTVFNDESAASDSVTLDWSTQTDLDKVRILVSSNSMFETYEFSVELYNQSKSFTLNLQKGYFIQFQAQDEDGWKQRLLDDTIAPNQVTGVAFNGKTLTWDEAFDNLGGNGVSQYHVEIADNAAFTNVLVSTTTSETQYALTSTAEATLYFRVNAEDYTGNVGSWSETVSGIYDVTAPTRPSGGNSTINGYSATLTWSASTDNGSGVAGYEYRIATDSDYSQIVKTGTTENCSFTVENMKYGTYYWQVRATDASGNIGEWSLSRSFATVDAISPGTPTNLDYSIENEVSLSAIWDAVSDDSLGSGLKGYEIQLANDSAFSNIVKTVSVTATEAMIENLSNATYYMRVCAVDNAGNKSGWTETKSFIIDKDTTAPTVTNVTADITTPTNGSVTVTATFSDDKAVASSLYKLGENGAWTAYTNGVTVSNNTTIYFKAIDSSGNESAEVSYKVTNIDKTKPVITLDGNAQTPVRQTTLTAATDDGSAILYRINNSGEWTAYTGTITVSSNATYNFKATDAAGNTGTADITFNNIDTVAPTAPTASANISTITNLDVSVSAVFSEDTFLKEYSLDGTTWLVYDGAVLFKKNGSVSFRGTDQAGNVSAETVFIVSNIDKEKPVKPAAFADVTEATNGDVFVTAQFSEDSVVKEYSLNGNAWTAYTEPVKLTANGIVSFRGKDEAGNESEVENYEVTNIIKTPPSKPIAVADVITPTNGDVLVSASFTEDTVVKEYSLDGKEWRTYTGPVKFTENGVVKFRGTDKVGNESEIETYEVSNIDKVPPEKPSMSADITTITNGDVFVFATFSEDSAEKKYSLNGKEWLEYKNPVKFTENGTVSFLGVDAAGNESEVVSYTVSNIDKVEPGNPSGLLAVVSDQTVALLWNVSTDDFSGVKEYLVSYSLDGQEFTARTANSNYVLNNADFGTYSWSVQAVDFAGNESAIVAGDAFSVSGFKPYTVEYSADNFEHVIRFSVSSPTLDSFRMPTGTYQLRVRQEGSSEWMTGDSIVAAEFDSTPQLIKSDADGNADVFFANPVGTWESCYVAQHVGSINDWGGTSEFASVFGKNKLADIIEGSTDANILLMTDDDNGDTLFVDDIYTASPGNIAEQQARIAQIDEIRAGAGNDIVDMTSQQFEYIGDGLTIRGGEGNDTIWANKGDNWLFGDAGNDRIVGASGNDVIAGGIGNDRMHGGGGNDVFTFCDNWGVDNVEQLATGSVTLWFAEGSMDNWNEAMLTYTDGDNSVKVSGVTADKVTLKFGDDGSAQFASLTSMGAFFDATTERIFEESGKGILASM